MALDATKIHQGPGKLWLAVTIPTTGNRLLIDTTGTPTGGAPIYAGATSGPSTVTLGVTLEKIMADQSAAPIDVVMTGELEHIDTTLKQSDMALLRNLIVHGVFASGTDAGLPAGSQTYEEISFGGVIAVPKLSVALISPRRDAAAKFVVSQLYSCYQATAVALPFQRGKELEFKVQFDGLADLTRTAGDQVGKIYRQT